MSNRYNDVVLTQIVEKANKLAHQDLSHLVTKPLIHQLGGNDVKIDEATVFRAAHKKYLVEDDLTEDDIGLLISNIDNIGDKLSITARAMVSGMLRVHGGQVPGMQATSDYLEDHAFARVHPKQRVNVLRHILQSQHDILEGASDSSFVSIREQSKLDKTQTDIVKTVSKLNDEVSALNNDIGELSSFFSETTEWVRNKLDNLSDDSQMREL